MYSSTLSSTLRLGNVEVNTTPRPLYSGEIDPVSICRRLGESKGRSERMRKISSPQGFNPRTVQPVASRYTDYAFPAHRFGTVAPNIFGSSV